MILAWAEISRAKTHQDKRENETPVHGARVGRRHMLRHTPSSLGKIDFLIRQIAEIRLDNLLSLLVSR